MKGQNEIQIILIIDGNVYCVEKLKVDPKDLKINYFKGFFEGVHHSINSMIDKNYLNIKQE